MWNLVQKYRWYLLAFLGAVLAWLWWRRGQPYKPKTLTTKQIEDLNTLHPKAKPILVEFVDRIQRETGCTVQITSAYRSFAHQTRLKNELGSMAATPGKSPHNYGLAIDIVIYDKNKKRHGNAQSKAEWEKTGVPQLGRSMGLTWGGDFKTHPHDPVHFDVCRKFGIKTSDLFQKGLAKYGSAEKIQGNKIPI